MVSITIDIPDTWANAFKAIVDRLNEDRVARGEEPLAYLDVIKILLKDFIKSRYIELQKEITARTIEDEINTTWEPL